MEFNAFIDLLIGTIVAGMSWFLKSQSDETKRVAILLNRTREDYATRMELRDDMNKVMDALHRVEDKLDKVLSK